MHAAEPFPHFVDDYLNYLYEAHPSAATMDESIPPLSPISTFLKPYTML